MSSFSNSYQNFDDNALPPKSPKAPRKKVEDPKVILKKVIEKELHKKAPIKQWSEQIENDLMTSVVANFERHFPKRSLCKTTLKGLFGRLKEAFVQSEQAPFSLDLFLKEHLFLSVPDEHKKAPFAVSLELAKQLKASWRDESVASLSVNELSAPIWALQKHLLADIEMHDLRAPFEAWDQTDSFIIENTLDCLLEEPLISHDNLVAKVEGSLKKMSLLTTLNEKKRIKPLLFSLYAKLNEEQGLYDKVFTKQERKHLTRFCSHFSLLEKGTKKQLARTEWVERLLSLYILGHHLKKDLPEHVVETTVDLAIQQLQGEKVKEASWINRDLMIFFNASLYLRCFFTPATSYEALKDFLLNTYQLTYSLSPLGPTAFNHLEFFIYSLLEKKCPILPEFNEKAKTHLLSLIIKVKINTPELMPDAHIATLMTKCNQQLKLSQQLSGKSLAKVKLKIHMWASAREMLVRHIALNANATLMRRTEGLWKKHVGHKLMQYIDHKTFIEGLLKATLEEFPHLELLTPFVKKTLTTYYLITWYTMNFSPKASSMDRWLFWHLGVLDGDIEELTNIAKTLLPNVPHSKCLARFKTLIKQPKAKPY